MRGDTLPSSNPEFQAHSDWVLDDLITPAIVEQFGSIEEFRSELFALMRINPEVTPRNYDIASEKYMDIMTKLVVGMQGSEKLRNFSDKPVTSDELIDEEDRSKFVAFWVKDGGDKPLHRRYGIATILPLRSRGFVLSEFRFTEFVDENLRQEGFRQIERDGITYAVRESEISRREKFQIEHGKALAIGLGAAAVIIGVGAATSWLGKRRKK